MFVTRVIRTKKKKGARTATIWGLSRRAQRLAVRRVVVVVHDEAVKKRREKRE